MPLIIYKIAAFNSPVTGRASLLPAGGMRSLTIGFTSNSSLAIYLYRAMQLKQIVFYLLCPVNAFNPLVSSGDGTELPDPVGHNSLLG